MLQLSFSSRLCPSSLLSSLLLLRFTLPVMMIPVPLRAACARRQLLGLARAFCGEGGVGDVGMADSDLPDGLHFGRTEQSSTASLLSLVNSRGISSMARSIAPGKFHQLIRKMSRPGTDNQFQNTAGGGVTKERGRECAPRRCRCCCHATTTGRRRRRESWRAEPRWQLSGVGNR